MKKRFISSLLMGALVVASTSMVTSCKDYDDDINNLEALINSNATDLTSLVNEKVNALNTEVSALNSQISALDAAYKAADSNLQAAITSAKSDANAYTDVQTAQAQAAAIAAAQSSLEDAVAVLNASISDANSKISEVNGKVSTQAEQISALVTADTKLQEAINLANAEITAAKTRLTTVEENVTANQTAIANAVAEIQQVNETLTKAQEGLQSQISLLGENLDATNATVASNKAETDAKLAEVEDLIKTTQTALEGADATLQEQITQNATDLLTQANSLAALSALVDANYAAQTAYTDAQVTLLKQELGAEIETLKTDLLSAVATVQQAQSDFQTAQETINEALKAADATQAEDLASLAQTVESNMTALTGEISKINDLIGDIQKDVAENATDIDNLQETVKSINETLATKLDAATYTSFVEAYNQYVADNDQALKDLESSLNSNLSEAIAETKSQAASDLSAAVSGLESKLTGVEEDLQAQIDALKTQLGLMEGDEEVEKSVLERITAAEEAIETINGQISDINAQISDINEDIEAINDKISANIDAIYAGNKRLKSLVFAPTTYIDGIEAIKFASLQYNPWTNLEADKGTGTAVIINDAHQVEEYFVNPENISLNDIESLSYVSNTATNTRAVSASAPIKVVSQTLGKNANGQKTLQVTLGKNGTSSLGSDDESFTIVALKAVLVQTEAEKEAGEQSIIYSDWARLYETTNTPYIHSTIVGFGKNANGSINESVNTDYADSHYWSYSEVYNGKGKSTELSTDYATKHIAKEVFYKDTLDLNTLVMVCDKSGTTYSLEKYGLKFEFAAMEYNLLNEGDTEDATNQKNFVKFVDGSDSKILSTARNNTSTANRDAIDKQPMIQAVLRDTVNNKVVDVRYFKIKWVDESNYVNAGDLASDTKTYVCDAEVSMDILEEEVNKIYTEIIEGGMSRDEFHSNYTLDESLYASAEEAMKGTSATASSDLGTIKDLEDEEADGQTHNLRWTINTTDLHATQAEYEAGTKTVTAYARFVSNSNPQSGYVFGITMTLNIPQIQAAYNLDQVMWDDTQTIRTVNPLLETDALAQDPGTTIFQASLLKGYIINGKTPSDNYDLVKNVDPDNVQFVFDDSSDKIAELKKIKSGTWTVDNSNTGISYLKYNGTIAASIEGDVIKLQESALGEVGSEPTSAALLLIGNKAPVKLIAEWCTFEVTLQQFYFQFMKPLVFDDDEVELTLYDIVPGGSQSTSFAGTLTIREQFAVVQVNNRVVWDNKLVDSETDAKLVEWYGVEGLYFDTDNAKINVNKNGVITSTCSTKLSDIQNDDTTPKYSVAVNEDDYSVTFYNMSGNSIGQDFKIEIPVTVETKWQKDDMKATIVVNIKANI